MKLAAIDKNRSRNLRSISWWLIYLKLVTRCLLAIAKHNKDWSVLWYFLRLIETDLVGKIIAEPNELYMTAESLRLSTLGYAQIFQNYLIHSCQYQGGTEKSAEWHQVFPVVLRSEQWGSVSYFSVPPSMETVNLTRNCLETLWNCWIPADIFRNIYEAANGIFYIIGDGKMFKWGTSGVGVSTHICLLLSSCAIGSFVRFRESIKIWLQWPKIELRNFPS